MAILTLEQFQLLLETVTKTALMAATTATDNLIIVGMTKPLLVTKNGANALRKIYIVEGY